MNLLYYDITHLLRFHKDLPGLEAFTYYFKLFGQLVAPVDRTDTIAFPVRTKSVFPLPEMRIMDRSYGEVCNERANELLLKADTLDVPIYLFWSGGVDSTVALISLLKNAAYHE